MSPLITDFLLYHIVNYGLAVVMYTLVGQTVLSLFIGAHSEFFMLRMFRQITGPFVTMFSIITPRFMHPVFVPLYVAFWVMVLRVVFALVMLNLGLAPTADQFVPAQSQ